MESQKISSWFSEIELDLKYSLMSLDTTAFTQAIEYFDGPLTDTHTKFHSKHLGHQVSTSECNLQIFLGQPSVPLSRAFPCVL